MSEQKKFKTWDELKEGEPVYKFEYCRALWDKTRGDNIKVTECTYRGANYSNDQVKALMITVPDETNMVQLPVYKFDYKEIPVCKFGDKEFYCNRIDSSLFFYDKLFPYVYSPDREFLQEFMKAYFENFVAENEGRIRECRADILEIKRAYKKWLKSEMPE